MSSHAAAAAAAMAAAVARGSAAKGPLATAVPCAVAALTGTSAAVPELPPTLTSAAASGADLHLARATTSHVHRELAARTAALEFGSVALPRVGVLAATHHRSASQSKLDLATGAGFQATLLESVDESDSNLLSVLRSAASRAMASTVDVVLAPTLPLIVTPSTSMPSKAVVRSGHARACVELLSRKGVSLHGALVAVLGVPCRSTVDRLHELLQLRGASVVSDDMQALARADVVIVGGDAPNEPLPVSPTAAVVNVGAPFVPNPSTAFSLSSRDPLCTLMCLQDALDFTVLAQRRDQWWGSHNDVEVKPSDA